MTTCPTGKSPHTNLPLSCLPARPSFNKGKITLKICQTTRPTYEKDKNSIEKNLPHLTIYRK